MMNILIELIGISASVFVLVSFTQKEIKKIRVLNTIGSCIFIIYGILLKSPSLILLNSIGLCIQIYNLYFAKFRK